MIRLLLLVALLVVALLAVGLLLRILNPLPALEPRPYSVARLPDGTSRLDQALDPLEAAHPDRNGVAPLADRSLDVQYYIWHGDTSGRLLLAELLAAADRGVRVRLLLDDNGTSGLDAELAALDSHPGIEVRLFNPFTVRRPKLVGYLMDFPRLNRRMHNKAFIADSRAAIVGGRNIGDEYFGATEASLFADLDVFAAGPVIRDLAADFDRYWHAPSAFTLDRLLPAAGSGALAALRADLAAAADQPLARRYADAVRDSALARGIGAEGLPLEWARVTMLSDDPAKALGRAEAEALLASQLAAVLGTPERSLGLVSAYFVPQDAGTVAFAGLARQGVSVTILTNALEATDVAAVHAGYARHRRALLKAGVTLWELKRAGNTPPKLGLGLGSGLSQRPSILSRASSLHAKTFEVDGRRLFVGSFNVDPRSVRLNTELGFLIESERLAASLASFLAHGLETQAYRVRLAADGRSLEWVEAGEAGETIHRVEPGTRWHQRAAVTMLSWLPIEGLL
jgi:putative cardiolipin synthase